MSLTPEQIAAVFATIEQPEYCADRIRIVPGIADRLGALEAEVLPGPVEIAPESPSRSAQRGDI